MTGASSTMASGRCRPRGCSARPCNPPGASLLPGLRPAPAPALPARSDPLLLLRLLVLPHLRQVRAALLWALRDRDLAVAVVRGSGPGRLVHPSADLPDRPLEQAAHRRRPLAVPTPAPGAVSVHPPEPAE